MPAWVLLFAAILAIVGGRYAVDAVLNRSSVAGPNEGTNEGPRLVSDYGKPHVVGRLQDRALAELSGLAASWRNPGLMWAHNDSGTTPVIYCLQLSGAGCGTWEIEGAEAIDWEDIASAPDENGVDSLYIADTGDNRRTRENITIYRVPEPEVASSEAGSAAGTLEARAFSFTYPDRPHDAEAIVVNRDTGDLYVITKEYSSKSEVFVARAPLGDESELERVASMKIVGLLASRTGASLSPSGDRIVFSTYDTGYELQLPQGRPFDDIWNQEAVPVDLGPHEQGEAVTYTVSGDVIVSASEGARSPIYAVERRD